MNSLGSNKRENCFIILKNCIYKLINLIDVKNPYNNSLIIFDSLFIIISAIILFLVTVDEFFEANFENQSIY